MTTIAAGTLSVGAGGATGTLGTGGPVVNNGTLQINRTGTVALGQDISGTGTLTKLATGVATLTGTNTYAGTTTITGGTLQVGNGGTTRDAGGGHDDGDGAPRAVCRSTAAIRSRSGRSSAGPAGLTQAGAGTTVLTRAPTRTAAATTVSAGTLQVGDGGTTRDAGHGRGG